MSKNDMVMVPRKLIDAAAEWLESLSDAESAERGVAIDLRSALLAKQHQGEPVEPYGYLREVDGRCQLSVGPERPADRAGGYATPWAAVFAGEQVEKLNYKAELYDEVWELATGLGYMNVTTAISSLRADLATVKADRDAYAQNAIDLRAQLAERDALLRTARKPLELRAEYDPTYPGNSMPRNDCAEALTAIDAALSASPEPRGALQFPGCAYADFNTAGYMPAGQAEKFSKSLLAHLGTNEEREPLSAEELGQARKRLEDAMRPLNADAPVEIDERAEFEADCAKRGFSAERLPYDDYLIPAVRFGWDGWQARAALERKP